MSDWALVSNEIRAMIAYALILFVVAVCVFSYFIYFYKTKVRNPKAEESNLVLDVAYFHERGKRARQEDSYYISPMDESRKYGLVVCVSDGMGGMRYGDLISQYITDSIKEMHPISFFACENNADAIRKISNMIFDEFKQKGGATLAMVQIQNDHLTFYSVGDSDIILIRNDEATILNPRQNYVALLIKSLVRSGKQTQIAYTNSKARALVDYMGNHNPRVIYTKKPMRLLDGDTVIVSSDGVTDAIPWKSIPKYDASSARAMASNLKLSVKQKKHPKQDNYTGVVIKLQRSIV
jgi:serine/threonine protein phosphatase PrpC